MRRWRGPLAAGTVITAAGLVPATEASAGVTGSVTANPTTLAPGESTTVTVNVTVTPGTLPGEVFASIVSQGSGSGNMRFTTVDWSPDQALSCTLLPIPFERRCTWASAAVGDTATITITAAADVGASGTWSVGAGWADQQGANQGGNLGDAEEEITVTSGTTTTTTTEPPTTTTTTTTSPETTTTTSSTTTAPPTSTSSTTTSTPAPPAAATTTVAWSSANPSVAGQPVTFTAMVSPAAAAAPLRFRRPGAVSQVPADGGSVTFNDGDTVLGTVPVEGGTASFTTSSLAAGRHTITVAFSGTATAAPSGAAFIQQVNAAAPAATLPATR